MEKVISHLITNFMLFIETELYFLLKLKFKENKPAK